MHFTVPSEVCTATMFLLYVCYYEQIADFDGLVVLCLYWVSEKKIEEPCTRKDGHKNNENVGLFLGYLDHKIGKVSWKRFPCEDLNLYCVFVRLFTD